MADPRKYQQPRDRRSRFVSKTGRMKPGCLYPVSATRVRPSEAGMVMVDLDFELDPVAGDLRSAVTAEMVAVFVPMQAIHYILDPAAATAGMTEVLKKLLQTGASIAGLEAESWTSKMLGISPKSNGGAKQVSAAPRLYVNAAINHLRRLRYENAPIVLHTNDVLTPALIEDTILEKMRGVLNPEDRVNGAVRLQMPTLDLPVDGLASHPSATPPSGTLKQTDVNGLPPGLSSNHRGVYVDDTAAYPKVVAKLNGQFGGEISLDDFYTAETVDRLTREMRQIMDDDPEMGAENILRWCHGLTMNVDHHPVVLMRRAVELGKDTLMALDSAGVTGDVMRTDMSVRFALQLPIPKTELGGAVVVFACYKPDETLGRVPDPDWTEPLGLENYVADELKMFDPQPVTYRQIDSDVPALMETSIAMYTGLNQLVKTYVDMGFNGHVDTQTVESKNTIWQARLPLSVSTDGILYAAITAYPFQNQVDPMRYTIRTNAVISTPLMFGATPVEELAVIETADLFED